MPRELTADEIFGTSKRINKELEELSLAAHSTIFANLSNMIQYRQVMEKIAAQEANIKAQKEVQERQDKALADVQARQRFERDKGLITVPQ